jgi:predicted TIM-barrel fold metal-dependent hydrolase
MVGAVAATAVRTKPSGEASANLPLGVSDADIHNALTSREALKKYLPKKWHVYHDQAAHNNSSPFVTNAEPRPSLYRNDSWPESGGTPGSDFDLLCEQMLDRFKVERGILHPFTDYLSVAHSGELGQAQMAALNDWMVAEWLDRDPRLYGAISVPQEDGERARKEIERAAQHPRFVNVTISVTTRQPLGDAKYWPLYEAATEHGLPVQVHVGGVGGYGSFSAITGDPTFFFERHSNLSLAFPQQVVSLLYSGVFSAIPGLQLILAEGALGWVPPLMWRLDRLWEQMGDQVPHLTERPSETIREHLWLTTQPLDDPEKDAYLVQMLDAIDMDDRILFASDYPHHDFDAPDRVMPQSIVGAERRRKYISENALAAFRFDG